VQRLATTPLLGRAEPMGLLRRELRRATQGHGGLVLVSGEEEVGRGSQLVQVVATLSREGLCHYTL
jgi:hypothetical protein